MKKITLLIASFIFVNLGFANTAVPSLAQSISSLSTTEINQLEQSAAAGVSDVFTLNHNAINSALSAGHISRSEARTLRRTLDIANSNLEFFDFDIVSFISDAISEGVASSDQVGSLLQKFNQLSPADKAIVGQESFSFESDSFNDLSTRGQQIVQSMQEINRHIGDN